MKNKLFIYLFPFVLLLISCNQKDGDKPSIKESNLIPKRDTIEFVELFLKPNKTERKRGDLNSFYNSDTVSFYDNEIQIFENVRFMNVIKINVVNHSLHTTIDSLLFESEFLKSKNIFHSSDIRFLWSVNNGRLQAIDSRNKKEIVFDLEVDKSGKINEQ